VGGNTTLRGQHIGGKPEHTLHHRSPGYDLGDLKSVGGDHAACQDTLGFFFLSYPQLGNAKVGKVLQNFLEDE
jgi:hypothetical protein